jgi:hypothetical protein
MIPTPIKPIPETPWETVEERFQRLAAAWHRDTDYLSSMADADSHPAYQEIIRLGPEVVPLLLRYNPVRLDVSLSLLGEQPCVRLLEQYWRLRCFSAWPGPMRPTLSS